MTTDELTVSETTGKKREQTQSARTRVLVTGGAGRIGTSFAMAFGGANGRYDLRLLVQHPRDLEQAQTARERDDQRARNKQGAEELSSLGEIVFGDITDLPRMKQVCEGTDAVLHLAANADASTTWDSLLPTNIIGTYNTMVAAKSAGCRRVVFASSIHAVSGHPVERQIRTDDLPNPGDLYGVTKVFGEMLGRYIAEQENMSVIAIRIGAFINMRENTTETYHLPMLDAFVSDRDLMQMFQLAIDDTKLRFAVFHGLSGNRHNRMDITDAREVLGYAPQDDMFTMHKRLEGLRFEERMAHALSDGGKSGLRNDL